MLEKLTKEYTGMSQKDLFLGDEEIRKRDFKIIELIDLFKKNRSSVKYYLANKYTKESLYDLIVSFTEIIKHGYEKLKGKHGGIDTVELSFKVERNLKELEKFRMILVLTYILYDNNKNFYENIRKTINL